MPSTCHLHQYIFAGVFACGLFVASVLLGEENGFVPFHAPREGELETATPITSQSADTTPKDAGVVPAGLFVSNDPSEATGTIQQVQSQVATGGSAFSSSSSPTIGSVEEQINNLIGAKHVKLRYQKELPRQHDQISREYDITPYTKGRGFPSDSKPQQTIIDWIIRQTGDQTWHGEPEGFITATAEKVYVYHTLEVHRIVADILDRFVNPQTISESYTVRLVSVGKPDWMTRAHPYLRPIPIGTPGVQGWLIEKTGYAAVHQELSKRNDYVDYTQQQVLIPNGCLHQITRKRQRTYLRDVQASTVPPGYVSDNATIDEGFHFSFVPLACLDGLATDVTLKLEIQQIERMIPVAIEVATQENPRSRHTLEAPQVVTFKLDEQIRWPKDKVLLLDIGTLPLPEALGNESKGFLSDIQKGFTRSGNRANYLLFVERVQTPAMIQQGAPPQVIPQNSTPAAFSGMNTGIPSVLTAPVQNGQAFNQNAVPQPAGQAGTGNTNWQGTR